MTAETIEHDIRTHLADMGLDGAIDRTAPLRDVMDSLELTELEMTLEDHYGLDYRALANTSITRSTSTLALLASRIADLRSQPAEMGRG